MRDCDAAVAIVRARQPEDSVLLMRRTERENDPWSGHWSFPGGRREPFEADLLDTALRELSEECGVSLARDCLETTLAPAIARRRAGRFLKVAPYVFHIDAQLPTTLDSREAVEAHWIPIGRLADPHQHRLLPIHGMPSELLFPSIEFEHIPLWGFTYRLMTEWLQLLPADRKTAGFRAAARVFDYLVSSGLPVARPWAGNIAEIEGRIPVDPLRKHLAAANSVVPPVNVVEVQPEFVKITGLDFEEYVIRGTENH